MSHERSLRRSCATARGKFDAAGRDDAVTDERRPSFETLLPLIERVLERVCARRRVLGEEKDDFEAWALLRLFERRQVIWNQYLARSQYSTYLDAVIGNLLKDYRIAKWGRWRASAVARRLGPLAEELEALLFRDRVPAPEAVELLVRSKGPYPPSRDELWTLLAKLPVRSERRPSLDSSLLEDVLQDERAEASFDERERQRVGRSIAEALRRAVDGLNPAQRQLVIERFLDERKIVDMASQRERSATPLYAQLSRALKSLRRSMEEQGIEPTTVSRYLGRGAGTFCLEASLSPRERVGVDAR